MHSAGHGLFAAELARDKIIVIKFLVGKIQAAGGRLFGPAGGFIRAALRAGPRIGRNVSPAIGARLRRTIPHPPTPAYSSSILRFRPINT